jgi:hypothetical protein
MWQAGNHNFSGNSSGKFLILSFWGMRLSSLKAIIIDLLVTALAIPCKIKDLLVHAGTLGESQASWGRRRMF